MSVRTSALIALLSLAASTARAQVGYPPARSPYLDLLYSQEITAVFGYYVGRDDPAGVAPKSAPLVGLHYEWRAGGPAHLTGELVRIASSRTVLDPSKPAAYRWIRYEDPDPIGRLHLATRRLDAASDGKSPAADADLEEALAVAKELGYREHRRPG